MANIWQSFHRFFEFSSDKKIETWDTVDDPNRRPVIVKLHTHAPRDIPNAEAEYWLTSGSQIVLLLLLACVVTVAIFSSCMALWSCAARRKARRDGWKTATRRVQRAPPRKEDKQELSPTDLEMRAGLARPTPAHFKEDYARRDSFGQDEGMENMPATVPRSMV
ncbi:hypothetical protein AUP68_04532 [Ilyonectria robusta]